MEKYVPYLPALLMDLCINSALINASFYSHELGLSTSFLGIISSVSALLFVVLAVPFGKISDKYGRTKILYIASLLFALISLGISFCKSGFSLAIAFSLVGITQALFWPSYEAWLADRHEEGSLQERIRKFNISWSIGVMIGPFISGQLFRISHLVPFYVASIVSLFNFFIILSQPKTAIIKSEIKNIEEVPEEFTEVKSIYPFIAWIANFSSWFTLGIIRYLSPKMTIERGITSDTFGNLMLLMGISQTIMFFLLGTKSSRKFHYRLMPLVSFQIFASIALLLMWKFENIYIWAFAFFMMGMTTGMTYFSSIYYSLHGNLDTGKKSGLHEAILGSGKLLGPLVGGTSADRFGTQSPYIICSAFYLISTLGGIIIRFGNLKSNRKLL